MAGTMVGLLLGGAAIHSYFSYLSGKLYKQDSFKLKCFLHVVMALAVVSPHSPSPAWPACCKLAPHLGAPASGRRVAGTRGTPRRLWLMADVDLLLAVLAATNHPALLWRVPLRDVSLLPHVRVAPDRATTDDAWSRIVGGKSATPTPSLARPSPTASASPL